MILNITFQRIEVKSLQSAKSVQTYTMNNSNFYKYRLNKIYLSDRKELFVTDVDTAHCLLYSKGDIKAELPLMTGQKVGKVGFSYIYLGNHFVSNIFDS